MKKTLAIVLSCVVLVAAFFAVAMITSADATDVYASTVEVILADGSTVYLGKQPTFGTGDDAGNIVGYQDDNILNILTLKEGTMKFDETTGTLTVDGVNGVKKISTITGSLVIVAKGVNVVDNSGADRAIVVDYKDYADAGKTVLKNVGNLTIKGDGTLKATSNKYTIMTSCGNLEVTGDVTVESTGTQDAFHASNGTSSFDVDGNWMKFSGNSKVTVTTTAGCGIRTNRADSSIYITENANVTINSTITANWSAALKCHNFEMSGGTCTLKVKGGSGVPAPVGLDVHGGAGTFAKFTGGTLDIDVESVGDRGHGILLYNTITNEFSGTVVDVNVKSASKAGNSTSSGGIVVQNRTSPVSDMNVAISGGLINVVTDANTNGYFYLEDRGLISITGGTLTGSSLQFFHAVETGNTLNISGGNFNVTSSDANIYGSDKITQSGTTIDATAKTFTQGTVGTVAPVSKTCSQASNAVKTPVEVTENSTATVSPVIKLADATVVTVTSTTPYVGATEVISVAGNKATQAAKQFDAAPEAPVNVKFSNITTTGATVSWDATNNATAYAVYVGGQKVGETDQNTYSFALTGLTAKTEYKVQIEASNQIGTSPKSAEVTLTTATEGVAASVTITPATGDAVELNAANTTYNGATGTAVFDAATGTLTITDLTGVKGIFAGDMLTEFNLIAKGTNTFDSDLANVLKGGYFTIAGDGKIVVNSTKTDAYPILGQASLTFAGSVEFSMTSATSKGAVHVSRGQGTKTPGIATITIKENAKVTLDTENKALYIAGEVVSLIITDNAVVNVTNRTKNDVIHVLADTDNEDCSEPAKAYMEVSGNAKLTFSKGNAGARVQCKVPKAEGHAEILIKDKATVEGSAPGQVLYAVCDNTSDNDQSTITITGNPTVKLTNTDKYACLQVTGDNNTVTLEGGTVELSSPGKSAFFNSGKTTWNINHVKTMVAGDDAASAAAVEELNTTDKYFKIVMNNPNTSDNVLPVVAIVAGLSAIAVAAAVVLRKKSYNA